MKMKKLTARQVKKLRAQLDRSGYADIHVGECRFVAKGVKICRMGKADYRLAQKRPGSSKALRREAARQGIHYI